MIAKLFLISAALVLMFSVGVAPAMAVEIDLGSLGTPGGCTHTGATDTGFVCANGATFAANGSTFTASGFSNAFITPAALTFKPLTPAGPPSNVLGESGIGEN